MLSELEKNLEKITNQVRFIKEIIDGKLVVSKKKKLALIEEWRTQTTEANTRAKKASQKGRRGSKKLQIGVKGIASRKLDDSDSDFAAGAKSKKAGAKKVQQKITPSWSQLASPPSKVPA